MNTKVTLLLQVHSILNALFTLSKFKKKICVDSVPILAKAVFNARQMNQYLYNTTQTLKSKSS